MRFGDRVRVTIANGDGLRTGMLTGTREVDATFVVDNGGDFITVDFDGARIKVGRGRVVSVEDDRCEVCGDADEVTLVIVTKRIEAKLCNSCSTSEYALAAVEAEADL